ncbi:hypothetical protein [Lactococcus fujiensis]|uniref:Structural protein n=1 Tax=Lactococcus fujiensis JCM 16395 TaxID=1291764 RepID=A0A2A5RIB7_9LACT|nr:hypothetical protein [Lactococcus fujiensis]PCR98860.1 structural protein [Lactococcus fujiensis JCM 16395]
MKQLSISRKFKLITGSDIMKMMNDYKTDSENGMEKSTELMENVQFGLYLAFQTDPATGKQEYSEYLKTGEFDTDGNTFTSLVDRWKVVSGLE